MHSGELPPAKGRELVAAVESGSTADGFSVSNPNSSSHSNICCFCPFPLNYGVHAFAASSVSGGEASIDISRSDVLLRF
jgi:hypothetical protein